MDCVAGSADALRHVMGHFASGVTVVTALRHGVKHAMTATAVSSVSLVPPLILVCVSRSSRFHTAIMESTETPLPRPTLNTSADTSPAASAAAARQCALATSATWT